LKRDDQGEPVAILVTSNDITEHKKAEEALRRLNRELRAISNCNQTLLRATDEQSLLEEICRIVCEDAGYRGGSAMPNTTTPSVRPVCRSRGGYLATRHYRADTERGCGPTGTAIRSGTPAHSGFRNGSSTARRKALLQQMPASPCRSGTNTPMPWHLPFIPPAQGFRVGGRDSAS
jgi:hypothetical protein